MQRLSTLFDFHNGNSHRKLENSKIICSINTVCESGKCSPEPRHLGCKHAATPWAPQKLPADTGQGEMERCGKLSTLLVQFKPEDSIVIKVPVSIISPVLSDASSASGQRPYHAFTSQSQIPHQLIGNWGRDGAHLPILASDWSSDGHVTSIVTSDLL